MTDWKRKLAAYLHDPPEKAYDFGKRHHERAKVHAASFGVSDLWEQLASNPDWSAAAADRFIFPSGQKLGENIGEAVCPCFIHPVTGRVEPTVSAFLPSDALVYPGQADTEAWLSDIRPDWKSDDPQTLFLRAWRHWSFHAAGHHAGRGEGAELLPYLPADTRVADASIWHHCAIVSALEATREGQDPKAPLRPAFLLFQVGPVQEFIAQARSTRDLWSGSYLLSWLIMHAIKAVADQCGPDAIIFPSLKGQPLYDFLERRLDLRPHDNDILVPGIPNRFLALVPANFAVATVENAFREEWKRIAAECLAWLRQNGLPFDDAHAARYHDQVERHWHITWQLGPWQSVNDALKAFTDIPLGRDNPIHLAKLVAEAIPDAHKDDRCYRGGQLDPGWAWSAHYQLCQHALDARRSVRDFRGLPTDPRRKPAHRDALSGREEAVVETAALEKAVANNASLRHLFRHIEPLGAANLIKRVWHRAYLARLNEVQGKARLPALNRARESFDSVPSVAAGGWLARLHSRLAEDQELWFALVNLSETLPQAAPYLPGVTIGQPINQASKASETRWLEQTETEIFTERFWQSLAPEIAGHSEVSAAAQAVREFKTKFALGEPPSYYAVLALDGDQIGKWLSGEKSPAVENVISPKAADYFAEKMLAAMTEKERATFAAQLKAANPKLEKPEGWQTAWPPQSPANWIKAWLASPRPISPSWHLQFSEALANFGLYAARRIVEDIHHGQLIYSGGDDVLAMLPADEAIACAKDLRAAFQGRHADMSPECQQLFCSKSPEGFLWLASPRPGEPSGPLLVPGPRMTVSVGLAIGHVREPLQDMIAEAQAAEKRAKAPAEKEIFDRSDADPSKHTLKWKPNEGWDRDALAVTLFKRSGETIRWGARFGSPAFPLLESFQRHYRPPLDNPQQQMPISGKFPYRVAELLGRFQAAAPLTPELRQIAEAEFTWIINQQIRPIGPIQSDEALTRLRQELLRNAAAYLDHLRDFAWDRPTPNGGNQRVGAPRPLREFVNLFLIEAFIRRQAD
jgi:CRISPR-associated protein Cmr2